MKQTPFVWTTALALSTMLGGCRGIPGSAERQAREDLEAVTDHYRPGTNRSAALPELRPSEGLSNHLAYALLNSPRVEATYREWAASVERITLERSLPDPQVTFQADIAEVVQMVMPGFMQAFPGPGKLSARAEMAAGQSEARYFALESAILATAYELKRTFYELYFLDEELRINRENLVLLQDLERMARAQVEAGKVTLQDVLRAQLERDRLANAIVNLEDSREPRFVAFKAALGLHYGDPDPPVPSPPDSAEPNLDAETLLQTAFDRNPRLKRMESEVRSLQTGIALAYKENVPDFSLGLMADVKANPTLFRPLAGMTLPVWRDKVAAGIARAKAEALAAEARWNAEQITLAVELAEKSFAYREITRNLELLQRQLIPKARLSVEIARAGYRSGNISFFNLIDAERQQLAFQLEEVEARTRRQIVIAELSLLIAGVPPPGAPLRPDVNPET